MLLDGFEGDKFGLRMSIGHFHFTIGIHQNSLWEVDV